ncbi:MAG: DUF4058 family protein [Chloroflexi bacterium]|nr:DUF4058 family protein [Chloroflexota bacterium]
MPSPFPGIDPFIEGQAWADFHARLITEISDLLVPDVRPRYAVRVEERVYIEHHSNGHAHIIRPDVTVLGRETRAPLAERAATMTVAATPVILTLPIPERIRETFLVVHERATMEVITVIEVLSLGNKRAGSDGQREYLNKREAILQSAAHLVELDLLRGGQRLPTIEPLPAADYFAFVCRAYDRPEAQVYAWTLRQNLPIIPIPLERGDPDVMLDLQNVFTRVYDRAGYDYSLDYHQPIQPAPDARDAEWINARLPSPNL